MQRHFSVEEPLSISDLLDSSRRLVALGELRSSSVFAPSFSDFDFPQWLATRALGRSSVCNQETRGLLNPKVLQVFGHNRDASGGLLFVDAEYVAISQSKVEGQQPISGVFASPSILFARRVVSCA